MYKLSNKCGKLCEKKIYYTGDTKMEYERIKLDYNSLEDVIDDKTLDLHYNVHYKNYTQKLNELLKKENYNYNYTPIYLAKNIDIIAMENRSEILYNLGGYLNHSLYFFNLTDKKKDIPNIFLTYFICNL